MTKKWITWLGFTSLLFTLVVISGLLSLTIGELKISPGDIIPFLKDRGSMEYFILMELRIPRLILAFAVGGALSLSGAILQGIFRNPLVEPYTLGISGGAALGVALVIVSGIHLTMGGIILPIAGFIGSITTIFFVGFLGFLKGVVNINRMLLIGVMISFISSSTMMLLMSLTTADNLHGIVFWMMGSLNEPNHLLIKTIFFSSIAGLLISYFFARPLNALILGEEKAVYLGINSKNTILVLFIITSLLTGFCVAITGVIGFVGLVIPHLIRFFTGSDYRFLLIGSFLGGSLFLIVSDIFARTIISPNELPVGVITGIAGGILFIAVLTKSKNRKYHGN